MKNKLWSKLPHMRCDYDCGACCGIVAVTPKEFTAVEKYISNNNVTALKQRWTCPFYQEGKCAIYSIRPSSCKLFGHVPEMLCPRGYSVMIKNPRSFRRWMERECNVGDFRILHEFAGYSKNEMITFMKQKHFRNKKL